MYSRCRLSSPPLSIFDHQEANINVQRCRVYSLNCYLSCSGRDFSVSVSYTHLDDNDIILNKMKSDFIYKLDQLTQTDGHMQKWVSAFWEVMINLLEPLWYCQSWQIVNHWHVILLVFNIVIKKRYSFIGTFLTF